ncbi:MAG TPA: nucleoside deaminase [bacterium]|nr:nucleoside deaminase [bacterium]
MEAKSDVEWMREALKEARQAGEAGEVPVGAVVVVDGRLIGRGHNRVENLKDATAHAEIIAIGAASEAVGDWRLDGSTLYVTVEPCLMCLGAIFLSRIARVVFAAEDKRAGACGGAIKLGSLKYMDRDLRVESGVLGDEAQGLLLEFFSKLRQSQA